MENCAMGQRRNVLLWACLCLCGAFWALWGLSRQLAGLTAYLLAAAGTARVSTTAAAGKLLMEYGVLLCADEEKLLDGARKQAADLWRRVNA